MKRVFGALAWMVLAIAANAEEPQKVTLCAVKLNPRAFNQKLVQVTLFLSHGFEDFSALDPECEYTPSVWVEYGGTKNSDTMYCCGVTPDAPRDKGLKVEGIEIPLVTDSHFRELDSLIRTKRDVVVRATIVGRFFAGERTDRSNFGGYGHMGCCSLLVLQQVVSVDTQDRDDLDYGASYDQPDMEKWKCGYTLLLFPWKRHQVILHAQKDAEMSNLEWVFADPSRVARESLAGILNADPESIKGLKLVRTSQGRRVYTWKAGRKANYMVVVSRPYWLSYYARDSKRVAWSSMAAYKVCN